MKLCSRKNCDRPCDGYVDPKLMIFGKKHRSHSKRPCRCEEHSFEVASKRIYRKYPDQFAAKKERDLEERIRKATRRVFFTRVKEALLLDELCYLVKRKYIGDSRNNPLVHGFSPSAHWDVVEDEVKKLYRGLR